MGTIVDAVVTLPVIRDYEQKSDARVPESEAINEDAATVGREPIRPRRHEMTRSVTSGSTYVSAREA